MLQTASTSQRQTVREPCRSDEQTIPPTSVNAFFEDTDRFFRFDGNGKILMEGGYAVNGGVGTVAMSLMGRGNGLQR